jgi:hypothetical protein
MKACSMPESEDSARDPISKTRNEARRLLDLIKATPTRYDRRELARRAFQMVQFAMIAGAEEEDR